MKIFDRLKRMTELCAMRKLPRFVSLGNIDRKMFFIDCYTGKIYRLWLDYRTDSECIAEVERV